jgi:hypothetical protein
MALVQTYSQQFEMHLFLFGQQLLAQVAQDNNLDHMAMVQKYLKKPEGAPGSALPAPINNGQSIPAPMLVMASQEKARKPRKVNPDKVMCKGVTAKGQPCKFAAQQGCDFCKKHSEEGAQKAPRAPRPPAPEHNHPPGEVPQEICGVCESHGDITKPELPEEEFTLEEGSIRDKLREILRAASDSEPEEPEEPEEPHATLEEFSMELKEGKVVSKEEEPLTEEEEEEEPEEPEEPEEDEEVIKNKLAAILAQEDEDEEDEEEEQ